MSLRLRLIIIIGALVLIIGGISLVLVLKKRSSAPPPDTTPAASSTLPAGSTVIDRTNIDAVLSGSPEATPIPEGLSVKPITTEEAVKKGVQQLAKIFVERYGSYSSDSNFENINEVQALVTPTLWQRIRPKTAAPAAGSFIGVTTQVITMEITKFEADKIADITFSTLRTETKNGQDKRVQGTAIVTMVKQGDKWLVDTFVTK